MILLYVNAKGEQEHLEVTERPVVIGRNPDSEIYITDSNVSRTHAAVMLKDGKCLVRDLKSSNGTFVNGARIEESALEDGDLITVGSVSIKVMVRRAKGPNTMIRELEHEMGSGGKGYDTMLREIVQDTGKPGRKPPQDS